MQNPTTTCPAWCAGTHEVLYTCADEPSERGHFVEVGRLTGESDLVVGITQTDAGPVVELLHLDNTGRPVEELLAGEVLLTAGEALALGPLLAAAVARLAGKPATDGRVALARAVLAESQASMSGTDPTYDAARWHGRLEGTVAMLLEVIDGPRS